ncbi:type II secretion system protein E [Sandarakinorhabdus cyanobacteriorum]|uniref:Type II secretion system protein E n=1 Tax=Sandarakinorhabdus cyanobacteriorum TaxID=1981098 RepID=A0A255Y8U2_9SPHN|nr:CpaF family protein [Sandarakinorhabdus cyanobacteriorum]OYQ25652.1 type II secretion system protein E [Sandarakinorhabdus cyanobacteriorum]
MIFPTRRKPAAAAPPTADNAPAAVAAPTPAPVVSIKDRRRDDYTELKVTLHQNLIDRINLAALETMTRDQMQRDIGDIVQEMLKENNQALNAAERRQLVEDILDELLGLGPLEPLLKDPTISDIMVNSATKVFVERRGRIEEVGTRFASDQHLLRIIGKIVSNVGRRVDESSPMVDARLPDGSRINAIIPPLAIDGPCLSIRKFPPSRTSIDKLVEYGSMTPDCATMLKAVVASRRNVIVSGGTGSGKTTMLNALSASIGAHERVVTIEDSAELQLQQSHVVRLETRPANIEGRGEVNQRDLVKNALRMRPDRVILGEIRSGEAFDMLQAMNTGHDGSMTTLHANTPRDALSRLEQMIGMSGIDISPKSARAQIASAINVVLQLERLQDGTRRVTSVAEITGMEGDIILMQEIFKFVREGVDAEGKVIGEMRPMGVRPKFMEVLKSRGYDLPSTMFDPFRRKDS